MGNLRIEELFVLDRWPSTFWRRWLLTLYLPVGVLLLIFRVIVGFHVFFTACILRKTMLLRCMVLRVMCSLLGLVVLNEGTWDQKTPLVIANHVSVLDHAAIDLIQPCVLPSVWDIPNLLRWCLGYADLGVRQGRSELIRQCKHFCSNSSVPLLAFPEGAMTGGRRALLRFSTWPFDVSDCVQPAVITVHRPFFNCIAPSVLGGTWWQDTLYFLFVPVSIIHVRWQTALRRRADESVEAFSERAAVAMASALGLRTSMFTGADVVEAAKRHLDDLDAMQHASGVALTPSQLDSMAMRLKQTFPGTSLHAIRDDLDRTKNAVLTSQHIRDGRLRSADVRTDSCKVSSNPTSWKQTYDDRKWAMIEENRLRYMERNQLQL